MNKYSSKAIKTAATVGMSLAMVLSAVPAVGNATAAQAATVCKKVTVKAGDVYEAKSETIGVIKTAEGAIADAKAAYTANPTKKSTKLTVDGNPVEYSFGFKLDSNDVTYPANVDEVTGAPKSSVTYGWYITETVGTDEGGQLSKGALLGRETVVEVKTVAAVKTALGEKLKDVSAFDTVTKKISVGGEDRDYSAAYRINGGEAIKITDGDSVIDTNWLTGDKIELVWLSDIEYTYTGTDCEEQGAGLGITDRYTAKNVYNEIVSVFDKDSLTFENVKPGDEVDFKDKAISYPLGKVTILSKTTRKLDPEFKAVLKELARYLDNTTDEGKAVERLLDMDTAMNDMFKAGGNLAKAEKYDEDTEFKTTSAYANAAELLEDFNDFDTYLTNLNDADYDRVTEAKSILEDLVGNYVAENDGDLLDTYLTNLDKFYEAFVDKNGDAGITKAQIDAAIKQIKNGTTFTDVKGKTVTIEKSDYTTFKENSGVEEYMTKFEDMYDAIEAVKDAVAKSNEAYKDLIKGDTSVKDFLTNKDSDRKLTSGKEFSSIKSNLTVDEFKILKAYKEDVLDAVLTLETKQVGNSYVNKSEKSIYATTAQLNTVLNNIGNGTVLDKGVFTKLDKEKGEFNWDKLVAHMEKVEASLEAVTTAIEKLDSISLTANDRAAIIAADDAVYFLTGDGADNLTSAQTRTVKNADRKVAELMEAYRMKFGSINSEVNGWVNKGNGDWAYYENGNAVTKWVASGSDWYYVRGGVMLRNSWIASDSQGTKWYYVDDAGKMVSNTTVNGYTFNSYGVWVK